MPEVVTSLPLATFLSLKVDERLAAVTTSLPITPAVKTLVAAVVAS